MIGWLLRKMGVHDEHPKPEAKRGESAAEIRYDATRRETIQHILHSDREVKRMVSWQDLYDPGGAA